MMQQVPPWLEPLLTTRFFSTCGAHAGRPRSECNKFCLDCRAPAFCYYCRQQRHAAHRVIQVRRSSYHDVVRVADVEEALDVAGVQTYVINGARVLFLNQRPQPPPRGSGTLARGTTYSCRVCARALLDTFRFCSLGCKVYMCPAFCSSSTHSLQNKLPSIPSIRTPKSQCSWRASRGAAPALRRAQEAATSSTAIATGGSSSSIWHRQWRLR
ncbi:uncharacterized protein LOC100828424 isoform X1 [Brachypodium distachyon]|uniref:uncharacterized protein LOC100828424 isoform X1 n=1 Tax=Brachypodium distachyon TaxID=15368 RepID=UPI000D0D0B35|nr:uncharacterized protein LOC100828424 isoform X1 [Brachypodium distachyon]|eukprot:XP_024318705.1 uncharacterized protein LOC100828424 isoform X1 [Brachypodium distachyon]